MPLHPAIVHLPIGLALILPIVAGFAWLEVRRERFAALGLVLVLAGLLFGSAIVARQTGEQEEDRVEDVVGHNVIEAHEESSNYYTAGAGLLLALSGLAFAIRRRPQAKAASLAVTVLSMFVATAGLVTGHKGGQIIYEHGGGRAYSASGAGTPSAVSHDNDSD